MRWAVLTLSTIVLLAVLLVTNDRISSATKSVSASTSLRTAGRKRGLLIGAAADAGHLDDSRYAEILYNEFSELEPENEMKFAIIHPRSDNSRSSYDFVPADRLVEFAREHEMAVRGHTLVWHRQLPTWLTNGRFSSADLANILRQHITTVLTHYEGTVYAWDVANEAFEEDGTLRETIWYNNPGIGFSDQGTRYLEEVFRWARARAPKAQLFYNDVGAETLNKKSDAIFAMASDFGRRGVPLDGIGMQMHVDLSFGRPANLASFRENLERFAALGMLIHITEMDVRLPAATPRLLAKQADVYKQVASICVQISNCKLLQTWGVTDRYSWISGFFPGYGWGLLWDANYEPKPSYMSLQQALQH